MRTNHEEMSGLIWVFGEGLASVQHPSGSETRYSVRKVIDEWGSALRMEHRVQGDLFNIPNNDAPFGPPQASTLSFARSLKEKGLAVDKIAGVYGKTATIVEFRKAIEINAQTDGSQ